MVLAEAKVLTEGKLADQWDGEPDEQESYRKVERYDLENSALAELDYTDDDKQKLADIRLFIPDDKEFLASYNNQIEMGYYEQLLKNFLKKTDRR